MEASVTTEEKIKEAAKKVFQQKGYAATRTRDIAEEAGINLALLNYYFRSKERLFHIIMEESIKDFFLSMGHLLNDRDATLEQKIERIACFHHRMLSENSNLPLFIFGELQNGSTKLFEQAGVSQGFMKQSHLYTQLCERLNENGNTIEPINFILNAVVMSIFPFVIKPILGFVAELTDKQLEQMLDDRQQLIPQWISLMLESKQRK